MPAKEVIKDNKWLEEEFTEKVQKVRSVESNNKDVKGVENIGISSIT